MKSYTPKDSVVDLVKAEIGRNLISSNGGGFYLSLHAIRTLKPAQVFDAQGINLSQVVASLLSEYFRLWMQNPLRMNPQNNK